jgi:hypothetical protein
VVVSPQHWPPATDALQRARAAAVARQQRRARRWRGMPPPTPQLSPSHPKRPRCGICLPTSNKAMRMGTCARLARRFQGQPATVQCQQTHASSTSSLPGEGETQTQTHTHTDTHWLCKKTTTTHALAADVWCQRGTRGARSRHMQSMPPARYVLRAATRRVLTCAILRAVGCAAPHSSATRSAAAKAGTTLPQHRQQPCRLLLP